MPEPSPGGNEQGLLGMAFDPNFVDNGLFYVNVTVTHGATQIRRYRVSSPNPNLADPHSVAVVLSYAQPFGNHNGGWDVHATDGSTGLYGGLSGTYIFADYTTAGNWLTEDI